MNKKLKAFFHLILASAVAGIICGCIEAVFSHYVKTPTFWQDVVVTTVEWSIMGIVLISFLLYLSKKGVLKSKKEKDKKESL